jgi:hypothetical protein
LTTIEKARIAAEIKAFKNTDFSDCPELTDEQLARLKPSHYRKPVIEPASPEECARAKERVREYHENPSSFVPLEDIL